MYFRLRLCSRATELGTDLHSPVRDRGSRILDGITGGNNAVTQAYVADITTHEEKGFIFGTLGGIAGLGMIVGPGVGGLLASGPRSYLDVTLCGIALSAITLLCIHIFLQESLSPERRKPKKKAFHLEHLPADQENTNAEPTKNHQKLIHRASALQQHDGIIHCDYRVVYYRSLSLFIKNSRHVYVLRWTVSSLQSSCRIEVDGQEDQ